MSRGHVTFGDFVLDPRHRKLWHRGEATGLGSRAADILTALLSANGALVTKDELLTAGWPGQIAEENALQAQISGLRKALGEAGQSYIVTVPGRGYRLVVPAAASATVAAATPSSGRPSIAVLAFDNLSGDPADECFADGMAEDLITELSRSRSFLIIARNSSFTFKGRRVDIRQIGQELGVRYVLEGSIRRAGNQIRVTAQLIEAEGGVHVWAERYDRLLTDLFETQDDITFAVTRAIEPAVESAERSRLSRKRPENLDAWEALQRARSNLDAGDWRDVDVWFRRSIELDPGFAAPHADRGFILISAAMVARLPYQPARTEAEAESWQAIRLDPDEPTGYAALAGCRCGVRDWRGAVHSAARAVELGPSSWLAHWAMIMARAGAGDLADCARHVELLRRIGPRGTGRRVARLMDVLLHFHRADYQQTAAQAVALLDDSPYYVYPLFMLAASLGHLGRRDEAAAALARWIEAVPGQSTLFAQQGDVPWWSSESSARMLDGLRKAGWSG